LLPLKINTKAA